MSAGALKPAWRRGVYEAIARRRDVRAGFRPAPLPEALVARLLAAAHQAPSVGFMQPWDFLLVRDAAVRRRVHRAFLAARRRESARMPPARRRAYRALKLEGLREAPLHLCVTSDASRLAHLPLGRTAQPDMDRYSAVCAVQNLWLAARAEGVGVGWVSILDPEAVRRVLGIPAGIRIVAYLCLGYVHRFAGRPDLEAQGWTGRLPLKDLVRLDRWDGNPAAGWPALARRLASLKA